MGDVGEAFNEYRKVVKTRKKERENKNMEIIKQCEFKYITDMSGTVLFKTDQGTVCFYPTVNKFMFKKKVCRGGANRVLAFIRNIAKQVKDE